MFSRFKKLGHTLQKAGKNMEEGFEKAGKSVGKGIERASKSAKGTSTKAASTTEARTDAATTAATRTPSERGSEVAVDDKSTRTATSVAAADQKSSTAAESEERRLHTATPRSAATTPRPSPASKPITTPRVETPRPATPAESEIHFDLDADDDDPSPPAPPPPPRAPPSGVPSKAASGRVTAAAGAAKESTRANVEETEAPLPIPQRQVRVVSHQSSAKSTPAESQLSVHDSERGRGGSSGVDSARLSDGGASSIQFDMNSTGNNTANASAVRGSKQIGGTAVPTTATAEDTAKKNNKVKLSGSDNTPLTAQMTSSINFDVVGEDEEAKVVVGSPSGKSPLIRQSTATLANKESSDLNFVFEDDKGEEVVTADAPPSVKSNATGNHYHGDARADGKAEARLSARSASSAGGQEDAAEAEAGSDMNQKEKGSRTKRRKSSSAKGRRSATDDEGGREDGDGNESDARGTRRKKTRGSPRGEGDSRDGRAKERRRKTRTSSASRRKSLSPPTDETPMSPSNSASPPPSPSSSSQNSGPASRGTGGLSGRPRKTESAGQPKSAETARSRSGSRRQKRSADSDASYRSGSEARKPAEVSADVRNIFRQCHLDAETMGRPQRRRKASPPNAAAYDHEQRRSRSARQQRAISPWDRQQQQQRRSSPHSARDYYYGMEGDIDARRRSGSATYRPRSGRSDIVSQSRSRSPRGKYSGVRHRVYTSHDDDNYETSSVASYVSYDERQRELYRGRPREPRRRVYSPPQGTPRRSQQAFSPVDWKAPPGRPSPWRRRSPSAGAAGADYYVEKSPMQRRSQYAPPTPIEYRVVRRSVNSSLPSPSSAEHSLVNEEDILAEVEYKLEVLAEQIAYHDFALEQEMMSSPFERLYHMNNRRDRSERRELISQFNKLQSIREKIVSGAFDREVAEREERQRQLEERLRDPNGVYMRLYQSPRRRGSELEAALNDKSNGAGSGRGVGDASGGKRSLADGASVSSSRAASPSVGGASEGAGVGGGRANRRSPSRTKAEQEEYFNRIYNSAMDGIRRKQEIVEAARQAREQREYDDLLAARLAGRMERTSPPRSARPLSPEALMEQARQKIQAERLAGREAELANDLLHGHRLTRQEEERLASRLTKHGQKRDDHLAQSRAVKEKAECTFKPKINEYWPGSRKAMDLDKDSDNDHSDDSRGQLRSRGGNSSSPAGGNNKCEELYRKGMAAKQHSAEVQAQRDRDLRLKILKSRLSEDHHFRKRVELDPSLAERFMRSLEV